MGRKAKHTPEQVFETADKIAASGQEVTPTVLLTMLGGGSLTTIYKHLDAWHAARKEASAPVVIDMPEGVKTAFNQAWQAAATEAAKEVAAIREKAYAEVKAMTRRLEEAIANIAQLEVEADADATKMDALEKELAAEKATASKAATEAVKRESSFAATVEQMQHQITAQQAELARVHAEQDTMRKQQAIETERFMERERTMVKELATAQITVERLTEQLKDQKQRSVEVIAKLEESKKKIAAELHTTRTEAHACATQLGTLSGQCEALRAQIQSQETLIKNFVKQK